jgi:hypothetical protein
VVSFVWSAGATSVLLELVQLFFAEVITHRLAARHMSNIVSAGCPALVLSSSDYVLGAT